MPAADRTTKPSPIHEGETAISCPARWRVNALRLLAAANDPSSLAELAEAIDALGGQSQPDWNGLMIIPGTGGPVAAVWVQPQPGNTARLWLPADKLPSAPTLLRGARHWAASKGFSIVQAVIDTADNDAALLLRENGFPHLVDLLYLQAETPLGRREQRAAPATNTKKKTEVSFESIGQLPSPRLECILGRIQESSLDCPGLKDVLSPLQAIEGFRHQGQFTPEHWCILRQKGQDAGALLMAPHPQTLCWELIYMGVLPHKRGHGLGQELVREALSRAAHHGAERVLLSVDARNDQARRLYEQTGFRVYARRSLYAWTAET